MFDTLWFVVWLGRVEHTRLPDVGVVKEMHKLSNGLLKILTIAAELKGAEEMTKACVELGIIVSLGTAMHCTVPCCLQHGRLAPRGIESDCICLHVCTCQHEGSGCG